MLATEADEASFKGAAAMVSTENERSFGYDWSLSVFLSALLRLQDVLEEYHQDIIRVDYRLYENLSDSIAARIKIIKILCDPDSNQLSKDKVVLLYNLYLSLVKHLKLYKTQVQELIRSEGGTASRSKEKTEPERARLAPGAAGNAK